MPDTKRMNRIYGINTDSATECKTDACMSELIPEYIEKMLENFEISGNIYGTKINPQISLQDV